MSKQDWRNAGIFNSHNLVERYAQQTGRIGVYLSQSANDGTRMNIGVLTGYTVVRPGFQVKNNEFGIWQFGHDWEKTLEAASEFVAKRYSLPVEVFVSIPGFGRDRFPAEIADWAKAELKRIKKAASS